MQIQFYKIMFGADPEFFFTKNGKVIGSEKVIPEEGVPVADFIGVSKEFNLIRDGVQAEFNVRPSTCRQIFSSSLASCFATIAEQAKKNKVDVEFAQTVHLTKEEMGTLSKESQQFGCSPSENIHIKNKISVKDASKYMYRSAGGHIHLSHGGYTEADKAIRNYKDTVPLLDILVGNTCVLLDRDPGNIERRKVYGKAGEYRAPAHGLEYRTLSNFWLRCYPLMSFVLGMARFAVNVSANNDAKNAILSAVDMQDIQDAINDNDFKLAKRNFDKIKDIVASIGVVGANTPWYPLEGKRIKCFEHVVEKGIGHFFKEAPLEHWSKSTFVEMGWERFVDDMALVEVPKEIKEPGLVNQYA